MKLNNAHDGVDIWARVRSVIMGMQPSVMAISGRIRRSRGGYDDDGHDGSVMAETATVCNRVTVPTNV